MAPYTPGSGPRDESSQTPVTSDRTPRIQSDMGAKPLGIGEKTQTDPANMTQFMDDTDEPVYMPVWMQRSMVIIFVMLCIEIGLFLCVRPWYSGWTDNSLILRFQFLREIAQNNFVKGMISGIGVLDIWIGIREALMYRDHRPTRRD